MTVPEQEYMTNHRNDPPKEIAEAMGRTYEFVRKFLKTLPEEVEKKPSLHMITETANGRKGVAVMTKVASERADAARKNRKKVLGRPDSIRQIRDE